MVKITREFPLKIRIRGEDKNYNESSTVEANLLYEILRVIKEIRQILRDKTNVGI